MKTLKKILIKKLAKENEQQQKKKTGLKSDRKKSNKDEIQKQLSLITIKIIGTKLELKYHRG
jgi:hypothetical protein